MDSAGSSKGTIGNLFLDSLEIRQFRAFKHLRVDHLGRVNLLVGKNNVGKTCALEALELYARAGSPETVHSLLVARDEIRPSEDMPERAEGRDALSFRALFHGRKDVLRDMHVDPIQVGPVANEQSTLTISPNWYTTRVEDGRPVNLPLPLFPDMEAADLLGNATLVITVRLGNDTVYTYPVESLLRDLYPRLRSRKDYRIVPCTYLKASRLSNRQVADLFDNSLTLGQEDIVLDGLRLISKDVERLNFIGERQRIPIVRFYGDSVPVPLRSLGDGMYRMLAIAASFSSSNYGILLIDEIETGLHYSVQPAMWRLVFDIARRFNVQVFATTHSWDCIEAFQTAAQMDESEGVLIRLAGVDDETDVTIFDEDQLKIIAKRHLEVR